MKRLTLAAALIVGTLSPASAGRFGGSEPFDFLFLDGGALQAAVGGAFAAGGGDANTITYNPAGLAAHEENHVSLMRHTLFQGVTRDHVALSFRNGFGLSLDRVKFGTLRRTTLAAPNGEGQGEFGATSQSLAGGFGWMATDRLSFGWSGKYIQESIDGTRAKAFAADLGAQYILSSYPLWRLGVAVQNIGGKTRFESNREQLPLIIRWGSAIRFPLFGRTFGFLADIEQDPGGRITPHAGITTIFAPPLHLRLGFNGRNDAGIGITAGFGLAWRGVSFDYAMVPFGGLGTSHLMSFGFRWGPPVEGRVLPDPAGKFFENNP
ncbi:MAG: hypothetical protein COB53_05420 [Elusimicrobia bacterium]|nr:MAG: hypothetical protein COB53_05420 [Elusimicrobiota bacterium]